VEWDPAAKWTGDLALPRKTVDRPSIGLVLLGIAVWENIG
jgi:hypothetical protein